MSLTKYCSDKKIWSGPPHPGFLFNDKANLGRNLINILNRNPTKVAQISDNNGIQMTNGDIVSDAEKIACGLWNRNCRRGDVVGFVARNGHKLTPTLIACFLLGAPVNAMDVRQNEDELYGIFKITKPKFIFCDDDRAQAVQNVVERLEISTLIIIFGKEIPRQIHIEDLMREGDSEELKKEIFEESCREYEDNYQIMVCSSGTTGASKAVVIPYQSNLDPYWSFKNSIAPTDCFFSFQSPFWTVYYIIFFSNIVLGITRIITTEHWNPELFLQIVKKYNVTHTLLNPVFTNNIFDSPNFTSSCLLSLKHVWCGGSLVTEDLVQKLKPFIPNANLVISYGMTEAGTISSYVHSTKMAVSVGNLYPGIEGIILDDNNRRLGPNEVGQVCVKLPYPIVEYKDNPEATKKFFNDEGFNYTGDLGFFDTSGFLHITGRCKELIKYMNFHVSGSEIERIVRTLPGVLAVAAVGIPDRKFNQLPAVVVVLEKDASIDAKVISDLIATSLPDTHKLRGGVYFTDSLPKTISGKIRRNAVEKFAEEMFHKN